MRRRAFLATVGTAAVGIAGCSEVGGSGEDDYDIGMSISAFRPTEFAVAPGTTVVWKNTSKHSHTVTAYGGDIPEKAEFFASGGYDSQQAAVDGWEGNTGGAIEQGERFTHEFTVPGTYGYYCIPHETNGMVGTIEVTESATRTPEGGSGTETSPIE
jgi:plastocyanin